MTQAEFNEEAGKLDDQLVDVFQQLTEHLASEDPAYNSHRYPAVMHNTAHELINTLAYRLQNGSLI